MKANVIIFKVIQHILLLHNSKGIDHKHWKGDCDIALKWGILILKPAIKPPIVVVWEKPPEGWVKINCDGCSKGNPGPSAVGGIIRDDEGRPILGYQHFIGKKTSVEAELMGAKKGLQLCSQHNHHRIILEMDAKVAVLILSKDGNLNWKWNRLVEQIKELMDKMTVRVQHQYREGNKIADLLANAALKGRGRTDSVITSFPFGSKISKMMHLEMVGIPHLRIQKRSV